MMTRATFRRSLADLLKLRKERLRLERGFESQVRERAAELRRQAREQRTAEAYEEEKNKPETEFDIINDYFREMDIRDLRERLSATKSKAKTTAKSALPDTTDPAVAASNTYRK